MFMLLLLGCGILAILPLLDILQNNASHYFETDIDMEKPFPGYNTI